MHSLSQSTQDPVTFQKPVTWQQNHSIWHGAIPIQTIVPHAIPNKKEVVGRDIEREGRRGRMGVLEVYIYVTYRYASA